MANQVNVNDLGQHLVEAKPSQLTPILLLSAGALLSICGVSAAFLNLSDESPANLIVGIIIALVGGLVLWGGYRRFSSGGEQFIAYENGLIHRKSGQSSKIIWEDVVHIYKTTFVNNQGHTQRDIWALVDRHNTRIHVGNKPAIGNLAEEKVWPRLWHQISDDLSQGRHVSFGAISIDQSGISYQDQHVPWHSFKNIQFGLSSVQIFTDSQKLNWKKADPHAIPNLPLLKKAIQSLQHAS